MFKNLKINPEMHGEPVNECQLMNHKHCVLLEKAVIILWATFKMTVSSPRNHFELDMQSTHTDVAYNLGTSNDMSKKLLPYMRWHWPARKWTPALQNPGSICDYVGPGGWQ